MCHGGWDCPLVPLLADEIVKDEPGQEAVLDRLLDLLPIATLRAWSSCPEATVGAAAGQVGYASPLALSAASKPVRGVSPRQHRLATLGR